MEKTAVDMDKLDEVVKVARTKNLSVRDLAEIMLAVAKYGSDMFHEGVASRRNEALKSFTYPSNKAS